MMTLNGEYVRILSRFTGDPAKVDPGMEHFAAIHIEYHPCGAVLSATDGNTMGVFLDSSATGVKGVLQIPPTKGLVSALKTKNRRVEIREGDIVAVVDETGTAMFIEPRQKAGTLEGYVPQWRKVISTYGKGSDRLLGKTLVCGANLQAFSFTKLGLRMFGGVEVEDPIFVKSVEFPDFLGAMMPRRQDYQHDDAVMSDSTAFWTDQEEF